MKCPHKRARSGQGTERLLEAIIAARLARYPFMQMKKAARNAVGTRTRTKAVKSTLHRPAAFRAKSDNQSHGLDRDAFAFWA